MSVLLDPSNQASAEFDSPPYGVGGPLFLENLTGGSPGNTRGGT